MEISNIETSTHVNLACVSGKHSHSEDGVILFVKNNMYNFAGIYCLLISQRIKGVGKICKGNRKCINRFSRQGYWSGLPFPSPGDLPDPGIKQGAPTLVGRFLITEPLLLLLSRFSRVQLCATPQTAAHQAPPSMGFSRQEYWSGVPLPSPEEDSSLGEICLPSFSFKKLLL